MKRSALFICVFAVALLAATHLGISSLARGERRLVKDSLLFPYFMRLPPSSWESTFLSPLPKQLEKAEKEFHRGYRQGNFLPAIAEFREALRKEPGARWDNLAGWRIAEAYQRMGHYHEAQTFWRKALDSLPTSDLVMRANASLGECLFKMGRFKEAMPLFQSLATKISSTRLEKAYALYRLGDSLTELGFKDEAGVRYTQAGSHNISPKWIPLKSLDNIIQRAFDRGDMKMTRHYIMTALSFHPDEPLRPRWLYLLSETNLKRGRDVEAAINLDWIIEDPSYSREKEMARMRLATLKLSHPESPAFFSSGLPPETWDQASHQLYFQYPGDVLLQSAVLDLGLALLKEGDHELGIRVLLNGYLGFYESWVTRSMRQILLRETKVQIHRASQEGDYRKAIRVFDAASTNLPETWADAMVLLDGAESYEKAGFYQISAALYQRVRKKGASPASYRRATMGLARSVLSLGNPKWALALIDEAASDQSWYERARVILEWASTRTDPAEMRTAAGWIRDASKGSLSLDSGILLARFYMDRDEWRQATGLLKETLGTGEPESRDRERWAEAWCLLGDGLLKLEKTKDATASYTTVLRGEGWGYYEKWAAYQMVRLGLEAGTPNKVKPYLARLLKEPEGSFFRELALLFQNRINPLGDEENVT